MKKNNFATLTFAVFLLISIQQINARPLFGQESEMSQFINYNSQAYIRLYYVPVLSEGFAIVITPGQSYSNLYYLNLQQLHNNTRAEPEVEMDIEKWMLDVKDDFWVIDMEEPLKLENWMTDPCNWLCQN